MLFKNAGKIKTQNALKELKNLLKSDNCTDKQKQILAKIISDTEEFIHYNEWKVGLECMCDNLYEFSVPINDLAFDLLHEACIEGNLESLYSSCLKELVA